MSEIKSFDSFLEDKKNSLDEMVVITKPIPKAEEHEDRPRNYMFFENLKTIKIAVDKMLKLDSSEVDKMLENGHDWAEDHIATSKDDIEEVCGFLCNNASKKTQPINNSQETE
jgi:hypothetical protein